MCRLSPRSMVICLLALAACGKPAPDREAAYVPLPRELWGEAAVGDWAHYRLRGGETEHDWVIRIVDRDTNRIAFEVHHPDRPEALLRADEVILFPGPEEEARLLDTVVDYGRERVQIGDAVHDALRVTRQKTEGDTVTEWYDTAVHAGGLIMRREGDRITELLAHGNND